MLDNIRKYTVILASKSPRRRELMQMLRVPFKTVVISGIEEKYPDTLPVSQVPGYLSELKADAYIERMGDDEMIITADTVVVSEGRILGKPRDDREALEMLMMLSGKTHDVVTGVTIATREKRVSFSTTTKVTFVEFSREEAEYYIDNYRPLDKAGAYGIQEWIGCVAVSGIEGSYYNVMGLPVHRLYHELKDF